MDNLINETNVRLQEIIDNLTTIKNEYENKLDHSNKEIDIELNKVKKYKEDFFVSKQKIEKMNSDIEGFEKDYQNLVERFKDDELANILIAANKEISAKIDERKRKIARDKISMNELVEKAETSKTKLVKLTAEKKALELCLKKILDAYEFYTKSLLQIINYSNDNPDNLSACFHIKAEHTDTVVDNNTEEFVIEENETEGFEDFAIDVENDLTNLDDMVVDDDTAFDEEMVPYVDDEDIVTEENEDDIINVPESETYVEEKDIDDEEINIQPEEINLEDEEVDENVDLYVDDVDNELLNNIDEIEIDNEENKSIEVDEIPTSLYSMDDLDISNKIDFNDSIEEENED